MAQITGITINACKEIVAALQRYEAALNVTVSYGMTNNLVKGESARRALQSIFDSLMNDCRKEIGVQIDAIEKIAATLDANYAKIDSQTTFNKS